MTIVIDTNVLLRLAERTHPLHSVIRQGLRTLRQDGHIFRLLPQNCIEFWNVATRPSDRNGFGLSPQKADQMLRLIERLFPILPESPDIYSEWRQLVKRLSVSGVQVHDARLVAAMKTLNVTHIMTLNASDFKRYASEGIFAIDPHS